MRIIDKRETEKLCKVKDLKVGDTFILMQEEYDTETYTRKWVDNIEQVFVVVRQDITTTHCMCFDKTGVHQQGMRDYIVKPVDIDISIVK